MLTITKSFFMVESGSVVVQHCTKTTNTKCKCRGEFVPSESDSSTCKCDIGYGLKNGGTEINHNIAINI